jgi:hypothetical protein
MATLETNDQGVLNVPAELIGGAQPHAEFQLEILGDVLVLWPVDKGQPFWRAATRQQRVEAFRRWAELPRPLAPDLSDESMRRESIHD